MLDSIAQYQDDRGYVYVGMSESWKKLCLALPCSKRVVIEPFYKTQWIDTTVHGEAVTIQAWKGNIPNPIPGFPGGIGGEVGIYRRDNARKIPTKLDIPELQLFRPELQPFIQAFVSRVLREAVHAVEAGVDLWWPHPQLNAQIDMRFTNPTTGDDFFTASPSEKAGGYWMSRWMHYGSYVTWLENEKFKVPLLAHEYVMDFGIAGKRFRWTAAANAIEAL